LSTIGLLSSVRLLRLRNFDVESFGDSESEVMVDLIPSHDVAFLDLTIVAASQLELSSLDDVLLFDFGERVPEELSVRDVFVESFRAKTASNSLDFVRCESESVGLDGGKLIDGCCTDPVLIFPVGCGPSVWSFGAIGVVVGSSRDTVLRLTVTNSRDEGANGSIDGKRREVDGTKSRDLSVVV